MKKVVVCLLIIAAIASRVSAQDEHDAIRYGFTTYQGTARAMSIGSALGSIGADFTSLSVNPAGIGVYSRSEFSFSPSFSVLSNNSTYLGTSASASANKFNLTGLGLVIASTRKGNLYKKTGWKTFTFALGMNRLATFKNEYTYTGQNNKSSFIEGFADDFNSLGGINANSINSVNYSAYGAYQTYLVDKGIGIDSMKAVSYVPYADGIIQTKKVVESGGISEYLLSLGGNYNDKLMLGATIGISAINYNRSFHFSEDDASGNLSNDFKYFDYAEFLATTGTGINLKLGAIIKPTTNFRIGVALHTPTHIELNDVSSISIESHTDSLLLSSNPSTSPITKYIQDSSLVFNYSLNTPYKAIVSAAFLFKKVGFITADVEYVDYGSMKYKYGPGYNNLSDAMNTVIANTYKSTLNVRVGVEARLDNISFRGGVAYYGSPYAKTSTSSLKNILSAGIGYREKNWFVDACYQYGTQKVEELPYIIARKDANSRSATIDKHTNTVTLTLGWKF